MYRVARKIMERRNELAEKESNDDADEDERVETLSQKWHKNAALKSKTHRNSVSRGLFKPDTSPCNLSTDNIPQMMGDQSDLQPEADDFDDDSQPPFRRPNRCGGE